MSVLHDGSEYSTDLQKCIEEIESAEKNEGIEVSYQTHSRIQAENQYDLLLMGGLSGRVDQTVHVMSLLHKLRKTRPRSFILSSESLAWVLDEVSIVVLPETLADSKGSHVIEIDHSTMGQTCGILPVGIDSAYVKTVGLKWNLGNSLLCATEIPLTDRLGNILRWRRLKLEPPTSIRAARTSENK